MFYATFFSRLIHLETDVCKKTQNTQFRWQSVRSDLLKSVLLINGRVMGILSGSISSNKAKSVICCKRGPFMAYINLRSCWPWVKISTILNMIQNAWILEYKLSSSKFKDPPNSHFLWIRHIYEYFLWKYFRPFSSFPPLL